MQRQGLFYVLTLAFVLMLSFIASAEQGIPIDIPGTQIHFFTLRHEETTTSFKQANLIWERLSSSFMNWVEEGRNPADLSPNAVIVKRINNGNLAVFLKDNLIVEVDEYHAKLNRASQEHLANVWADNLRQGVAVFVENNKLLQP